MKLQVVCLSLPRCRERRAIFDAEARRVGLPFEYVDGPDAEILPADQLLSLVDQDKALTRFGRRLGLSEVACFEGHRQIYRNLIDSGDDGVVVLEDDITFSGYVIEALQGLKALGPDAGQHAEVYFLGGRQGLEHGPLWVSLRRPRLVSARHRLLRVIKSDRALLGTWAYLITRQAAAALLKSEPIIVSAADQWDLRLSENVLKAAWVLEPAVAFHSPLPTGSLLEDERATLEAEGALGMPGKLTRASHVLTSPSKLLRSVSSRLGWRQVKGFAYTCLSRIS